MIPSRDLMNVHLREMSRVRVFDHDALSPAGHGPLCVPGCVHLDERVDIGWSDRDGRLVEDPREIEYLEAKLLQDNGPQFALVNLARDLFADAITGGASYNRFNNSNAYIGIGNSSAAHDPAQTDLQGGSKTRRPMDSTYPTRSANQIVWRATFGLSDANYDWLERAVFNASSSGQMLSRKVISLGTKTASFSWQITCTDTITI